MENQTLKELILNLEKELRRLGYSEGSMTFYKRRWQQLLVFVDEHGVTHYSERLGINFVEKHFNMLEKDFEGELKQRLFRCDHRALHQTILKIFGLCRFSVNPNMW
ncbi:MAG: integrase/recombinase XerD [Paraglaciecola sp.]|jgi:hypothetical protein